MHRSSDSTHIETPLALPASGVARLLRSISGSPVGWRAQRRGSFLVLVVGTLALLAVVMLVYVSVGNQDLRTKSALSTRDRLDDVPQQFADYLSQQIIAPDALATYYDRNDSAERTAAPGRPADEPTLIREAFDYPYTDFRRRSDRLDRNTAFSPIGTYVRLPDTANPVTMTANNASPNYTGTLPARWIGSDPWLASNEPSWLGQLPAGQTNNFSSNALDVFTVQPGRLKKDWLKISNVAPDGKFVNLYNLAPLSGGRRVGNLNAKPGFGTDGNGDPRLAQGLSLLTGATNFGPADVSGEVSAWGVRMDLIQRNLPAFWDSWQRGLFRPAVDRRPGYGAGDVNYLPYQFADADGDGMFDSRWMELTDSRQFDITEDASQIVNLLEADGKYRYFFATRIIDASGMVNVNTATDLTAAPDATNPVGLTPADIDLRRLLTLEDTYSLFRTNPDKFVTLSGGSAAGYAAIKNPIATDPTSRRPDNYAPAGSASPSLDMPPTTAAGYDWLRAHSTGSLGYTALRLALGSGQMIPLVSSTDSTYEYRGTNLILGFAPGAFGKYGVSATNDSVRNRDRRDVSGRRFWNFGPSDWDLPFTFPTITQLTGSGIRTTPGSPHFPPVALANLDSQRGEPIYPDFALRRGQFYRSQAASIYGAVSDLVRVEISGNTQRSFSRAQAAGTFGIEDLSELLTYRASNNINVLSNLERTVGGRDTLSNPPGSFPPPNAADPRKFDPLRSNRGPDLELARDDFGTTRTSPPDGQTDRDALLQLDADVRQHLTTVSGARALFTKRDVAYDTIEPSELKLDVPQAFADLARGGLAATNASQSIFSAYASSLLPILGNPDAWDRATAGTFDRLKTQFYGYDGPETALYAAAHMAVNLIDLNDADHTPSAYTLLLNGSSGFRNSINTSDRYPFWQHTSNTIRDGKRLDLDAGTTPTKLSVGTGIRAPAANIYGVEPQPFVTAVASFTVYTDTPAGRTIGGSAGDSDGWDPLDINDPPLPVTIRRDVSAENQDFMYRVVAFRLHNPFGVDLTLGDPAAMFPPTDVNVPVRRVANQLDVGDFTDALTLDRQSNFYYLEFGGRRFLLTGLKEELEFDAIPPEYYASPLGGGLDITPELTVIKAGASVICYAVSQMPREIITNRLAIADPAFVIPGISRAATIQAIIRRQLVSSAAGANPDDGIFMIGEIDPLPDPSTGAVGGKRLGAYAQPAGSNAQLAPNSDPANLLLPRFTPWVNSTGVVAPAAFGQLMQQNITGRNLRTGLEDVSFPPEERNLLLNTQVQLWRSVRTGTTENDPANVPVPTSTWDGVTAVPPGAIAYPANNFSNDQLVDRFRVPLIVGQDEFVDLDSRFHINSGTFNANTEVQRSETDANANDGLTITLWAAARRPQDPLVAADQQVPLDALPGFCIEIKDRGDYTASPARPSWNTYEFQSQVPGAGVSWSRLEVESFANFPTEARAGDTSLLRWRSNTSTGRLFSQAISKSSLELMTPTGSSITSTVLTVMPENTTSVSQDTPISDQYPNVLISNAPAAADVNSGARFLSTFRVQEGRDATNVALPEPTHSTFRVGDVLLPLGIGPVHVPFFGPGPGDVNTNQYTAWTTLGESIAAAYGFEPPAALPFRDPDARDPAALLFPVAIGLDPSAVIPPRPLYRHMFDRGNLSLDNFAPFYNADADPAAVFNPGVGVAADQRLFTQIPLALNVLDRFSAAPAGTQTITRSVPGLVNINTAALAVARTLPLLSPPSTTYGIITNGGTQIADSTTFGLIMDPKPVGTFTLTVTTPKQGAPQTTPPIRARATSTDITLALESLANIGRGNVSVSEMDPATVFPADSTLLAYTNVKFVITFTGELTGLSGIDVTAANFNGTAVSRVIPIAVSGGLRVGPRWWGAGTGLNQTVDLAATLVSYRDKVEVLLRPQSWFSYVVGGTTTAFVQSVKYLEYDTTGSRTNPSQNVDALISRGVETNITALGETPGFSSLGSLMTLRYLARPTNPSDPISPYESSARTNIDYMGFLSDPIAQPIRGVLGSNHSRIGLDSVYSGKTLPTPGATNYPAADNVIRTDGMSHEYKEKLAVMNGVINTVTTRSDYFIAWFIVHGYQKSDVENLAVNDVLTPSIARRFVMVVDRSNVVKLGDKPNILLFKEVPLSGR